MLSGVYILHEKLCVGIERHRRKGEKEGRKGKKEKKGRKGGKRGKRGKIGQNCSKWVKYD